MPETFERLKAALTDRYAIQHEVGRGGMATVYLAEDLRHRRPVALKVLHPDVVATVGSARFLREIEITAGLTHPHILPVHDSGEVEGTLYYVMPHIEGGSLRTLMERGEPIAPEEAVRLASEVAEALVYAHASGIMHRDIKPENVLLQAGKALVADFGIARSITDETGITAVGVLLGTPPYMSPDQWLGQPVDGRADVFALGVVLYEMLAGAPPFTESTAQTVLAKILTEDPPSLAAVRPDLPPGLASAVARAMARDPADRYPTVTELLEALRRADDELRPATGAGASRERSPSRVAALFGVSAAAALAAIYAALNQLGLPPRTFAIAAGLAALGLVLVIPTGQAERRRRAGPAPGALGRLLTWRNWARGGVLALLVWAATATVLVVRGSGVSADERAPRVAVLPFQNLGASGDAYLADGIADEIRGELVGLGSVHVIARASSSPYAGSARSLPEIGRELGVDYLLTGTVRWVHEGADGLHVDVVPELVTVRTGDILWHQAFRSTSDALSGMHADIALRVADALGVALEAVRRQEVAAPPTTSAAAYDAYLRARMESQRSGDATALRQAINLFERAVALDSTFVAAWSGLSWAASGLYVATGDRAVGRTARAAAERALALAPERVDGHRAMVAYYLAVEDDAVRAAEAAARGLRASPGDADLLVQSATAEQQLGLWDAALRHLTEAQELDPRSAATVGAKGYLLLRLRRHREAHAAYDRALALDSTDLSLIIQKAMVYLGEGALDRARTVIHDAARRVDEADLALHLATYYDLYWVLDDAERDMVLRLPPSAFLRGRLEWSQVRMQIHGFQGSRTLAQAYADSARAIAAERLRLTPDEGWLLTSLGLACAYLGRHDDALRAGERGVQLLRSSGNAIGTAYGEHQLARIYVLVGERERALAQLASLLAVPYYVSPGWLRVDPTFDALRGDPRFERLAQSPG